MKKQIFNFSKIAWLMIAVLSLGLFVACDDEEEVTPEDPIASFQFSVSEGNFLEVTFENFSQNATSYEWDFGDGNSSTDENPVHTYSGPGSYEVTLVASNDAGVTAERSEVVNIVDPLAAQRTLFGEDGKSWYLIADTSTDLFPLEVGPVSRAEKWFALGIQQPICERACIMDDTYTFTPDGKMTRENNGDFWAEGGVWAEADVGCFDTSVPENWISADGTDLSAWDNGTFDFVFDTEAQTLTVTGTGAFVGLSKVGTEAEFLSPQDEVTYSVVRLVDADVDTMTLETKLLDGGEQFGYWSFTLVSYDDPADQVVVELCEPEEPEDCTLPSSTPDAMFNTFASTDAADVAVLVPTESEATITPGVDDPADAAAAKVGEYVRGTAQFSDLKFQLENDVLLTNFTSMSVEVYFPGSNDYAGALSDQVDIFLADASCDEEFFNTWELYVDDTEKARDEWVTITFDLTQSTLDRDDIDLIGLKIGGENHNVDGTFYVRNFEFN
mgnify:CR=1 FL=1